MQVLPPKIEMTAPCRRRMPSVKPRTLADTTIEALSTLPSWASLPQSRRRRLVAVLGAVVQRTRKEGLDES